MATPTAIGLGRPCVDYSSAEFRLRAKGLAGRLGEPVERRRNSALE